MTKNGPFESPAEAAGNTAEAVESTARATESTSDMAGSAAENAGTATRIPDSATEEVEGITEFPNIRDRAGESIAEPPRDKKIRRTGRLQFGGLMVQIAILVATAVGAYFVARQAIQQEAQLESKRLEKLQEAWDLMGGDSPHALPGESEKVPNLNTVQQRALSDANNLIDSVLLEKPEHAYANALKGVYHTRLFEFSQAIERLDTAINSDPHRFRFHRSLGSAHLFNGDFEKAKKRFERAIEVSGKTDAKSYYNLGTLHRRSGERQLAQNAFRLATRLRPSLAAAWEDLGTTSFELGDLNTAIDSYEQWKNLRADDPVAHYHLGVALYEKAHAESNIEQDSVCEIPGSTRVRSLSTDRFGRALAALTEARNLGARAPELHGLLATLLSLRGDYAEASSVLEDTPKELTDHPQLLFASGLVDLNESRFTAATQKFERLATNEPDSELLERCVKVAKNRRTESIRNP